MAISCPLGEEFEAVAQVSPQTISASASATSSYVLVNPGDKLAVIAACGATTSVVDVDVMQATDDQGTSAAAITALNQEFSATDDNTSKVIDFDYRVVRDTSASKVYVAVRLAATGGTSGTASAVLMRTNDEAYRG